MIPSYSSPRNSAFKNYFTFLNFDELTPEILHRLINRIDVKEDGTPIIYYRFAAPKID
ncbi:DUF4368 domain-containing protein [Bacillus smithii]|uniref:DUF4368 domain-containing protein n=1 Tax=Bacillus smithii TaxID=1479 RepID=UPI003BEF3D3B